jgi:hypothetical protein
MAQASHDDQRARRPKPITRPDVEPPVESAAPHDEATTLFPTAAEDEERAALIKRIQAAGAKLSKQQRGRLKETFLGDAEADILTADVAALNALALHIEQSAAK